MATDVMKKYMSAYGIGPRESESSVQKKKREKQLAEQLRKKHEKSSRVTKIRAARQKYGTTSDKLLSAYTATELNAFKVAARRKMRRAQEKEDKATDKRMDRMHQLAGMPKNRGSKELKRMMQGGGEKETASEKKKAARIAQLKGMPKGRGTKLAKAMEALNKGGSTKPTTMTQPGGPGKKRPGMADGSKMASTTEQAKPKVKPESGKKMVKNPFVDPSRRLAKQAQPTKKSPADQAKVTEKSQAQKQQADAQAKAKAQQKKQQEAQKKKMAATKKALGKK
jgi:hypothetical protein